MLPQTKRSVKLETTQSITTFVNGTVEFVNTGFASGLQLWQVYVGLLIDDEVGRIASKKVIESIELNKTKIEL